jgi:hypothetical protein
LKPFVLLNRADRQIAIDYPAYRAAHRDKLYRYVDEFVLPKGRRASSNSNGNW